MSNWGYFTPKKVELWAPTYNLGGGFEHFLFSSLPGEMIQFDEHILQMGWFNHHLVTGFWGPPCKKKGSNLHHFLLYLDLPGRSTGWMMGGGAEKHHSL